MTRTHLATVPSCWAGMVKNKWRQGDLPEKRLYYVDNSSPDLGPWMCRETADLVRPSAATTKVLARSRLVLICLE